MPTFRRLVSSPLVEGGGEPLAPEVKPLLERSFEVNLDLVRVHTDGHANTVAETLGARAFAYGNHIFLGAGESRTDLGLLAHETAHVVQQQSVAEIQLSSPARGDAFEYEAERASAAAVRGDRFDVTSRVSQPRVQRSVLSRILDRVANWAYNIPGFRLLTIIIGRNPINMEVVDRSAANILRGLVELIPGGHLIEEALDQYHVFDRLGGWLTQQINRMESIGHAIRQDWDNFVDGLSWTDIRHPGQVLDDALGIFRRAVARVGSFALDVGRDIVRFIKDAILMPLARLASQTRGWDLLIAVLGRNPITGEPVPRTAQNLIGGFMRLIGQEEIWQNIQRANAIPRAWAWFQGALEGLLGFVRQIPSLFVQALHELELTDIIVLPRAFLRVGRVFGGFALQFFSWAGQQVWNLLQIIFEVVAPGVMPYLRRAAGAFRTIIHDPIGFVHNLVRAGIQGFNQFRANFLTHLRGSLISWLTGTLEGANIYIPQGFTFFEIVKFVLSVLGLTWQNIRQKLVRRIGETAVHALEIGFDLVVTLVRDGPAAAWERIQEHLSNLREMVMEQVMTFVRERIVQAAITRLVTSLNPAGAFIQAIIAIYNTIMFFVERLRQIAQVAAAFIDSISAIAGGVITTAANRVEQTMGGLLTLVISFLARLVGLGRVSDVVVNTVNRIRQPIDNALERVVDWIVEMARRAGRFVVETGQRGVEAFRNLFDRVRSRVGGLLRGARMRGSQFVSMLNSVKQENQLRDLQAVQVGNSNVYTLVATVNPSMNLMNVRVWAVVPPIPNRSRQFVSVETGMTGGIAGASPRSTDQPSSAWQFTFTPRSDLVPTVDRLLDKSDGVQNYPAGYQAYGRVTRARDESRSDKYGILDERSGRFGGSGGVHDAYNITGVREHVVRQIVQGRHPEITGSLINDVRDDYVENRNRYTSDFYKARRKAERALERSGATFEPGHMLSSKMNAPDAAQNLAIQSVSANRAYSHTVENWIHSTLNLVNAGSAQARVLVNVEVQYGTVEIHVRKIVKMLLNNRVQMGDNPDEVETYKARVPESYRVRAAIRSSAPISSPDSHPSATTTDLAPSARVNLASDTTVITPEEAAAPQQGITLSQSEIEQARRHGAPEPGHEQAREFTVPNSQ